MRILEAIENFARSVDDGFALEACRGIGRDTKELFDELGVLFTEGFEEMVIKNNLEYKTPHQKKRDEEEEIRASYSASDEEDEETDDPSPAAVKAFPQRQGEGDSETEEDEEEDEEDEEEDEE